uniref:RCC1-like domain-containing protein n=1 Tax=Glossina brevipalpis TaxID=37001 RepID=A0A1A9W278_9MUSC
MLRAGIRRKSTGDIPHSLKVPKTVFILPLPKRAGVIGRILICGQGDKGRFEWKHPTLVSSARALNVVDIAAGGIRNLLLTLEGEVYSFGLDDLKLVPRRINLPNKVLKISAGNMHAACLLEDGRVLAWGSFHISGSNMNLNLKENAFDAVDVLPGIVVCDIASGKDHLILLSCDGKIYTIGCGEQGQLGRAFLRSVLKRGYNQTDLLKPDQVQIRHHEHIEAIWATSYCTFVKESVSGKIFGFGLNDYKQLGCHTNMSPICIPISVNMDNILQIAGGQHHTMSLKDDDAVMITGRLEPIKEKSITLRPVSDLKRKRIINIFCGEAQSFALTSNGEVYAWGVSSSYQLGLGTNNDVLKPTLIKSLHTDGNRVIKVSSSGQHTIFLVEDEIQFADT